MDRVRKDTIVLFKSEGLSIIIYTKFIETDFLDVLFNLEMHNLFFIGSQIANLSTSILNQTTHLPSPQLSSMTNRHISNLSCNENEFNKAKLLNKSALKTANLITV